MRIGSSLLLLAVGAVLYFAVNAEFSGIDIDVIGIILMAAGAVGLVISLVMMNRHRESREITRVDPNTGARERKIDSSF